MIISNLNFSSRSLSVELHRLAKPQPRPVLNSNGSQARYPENFYPYYEFLRSCFSSVKLHQDYPTVNLIYPVEINLIFNFADTNGPMSCDIDNLVKPILDALTSTGIIKSDNINYINSLTAKALLLAKSDSIQVQIK